jgi:hypothetical protein
MLVAALAQLRVAASVAFGLPPAPWALDRLVDALLVDALLPPGASSARSRRRKPTS